MQQKEEEQKKRKEEVERLRNERKMKESNNATDEVSIPGCNIYIKYPRMQQIN